MSWSNDVDERPDETIRPLDLNELRRTLLSGLTPAQAEAATLDGAVLVLAGAGTGRPGP